jgi:hypothetical protein
MSPTMNECREIEKRKPLCINCIEFDMFKFDKATKGFCRRGSGKPIVGCESTCHHFDSKQ